MQIALLFVLLLSFVFGLGMLARRLEVPYPILFVIGGLAISFIPILPRQLQLDPDMVFFLILPPLLYIQAFFTSWRDFRRNLRAISLLAIGLVLATTVVVAYVSHALIPNFPLSAGFVLGAIISPPDAIAAAAIANRLGLPRRVVTILEGESLVNDATSLVIFRMALVATGTMTSRLNDIWIPGQFVYVSVGGVAVGLVLGRAVGWIRRRISKGDVQITLTLSFMTPYLSYLLADQFLHVSGVLAVVATGLLLGWEAPEMLTAGLRLQATAVWQMIIYLLNGVVFVLIGLQLPGILRGLTEPLWPGPILDALALNAVCIVVRMVWVFLGAFLPRLLVRRIRETEECPDPRQVAIIGWCGMRGIVSLAAALTLEGYAGFPHEALVQFLAFSVILTSLVVQGLTLPAVIRWLGVGDDGTPAREEILARTVIVQAVLAKISKVRQEQKFPESALVRIETFYREQEAAFHDDLADELGWSQERHHLLSLRRLRRMMIAVQRRALLAERNAGRIGDDVMHAIEHELDLEEDRLGTAGA
jgi:CPA1 family monovalent cation:H+ antiporter